jgi:hypothetical protein
MACTFLNCRERLVPLKYLGLPVGANPRWLSTSEFEPMLDQLRRRLNMWRNIVVLEVGLC